MEQTAISGRRSWVAIKSVVVWRNIITPRWTKSYFYASFKLLLSPWAVSKAQLPEFSGFSQEPLCETEVKNLFLCPHSFCPALLEKPATLFTANSYNFSHSLDCTTFFTVPSLSLHPTFLLPHLALLRLVITLSRLLQHPTAVASSNESPCYCKTLSFNQITLELGLVRQAFILCSP